MRDRETETKRERGERLRERKKTDKRPYIQTATESDEKIQKTKYSKR